MTCSPAEVIDQYGADVERVFGIPYEYLKYGPGGVFLGSVGNQAHQTHLSSHNCAPMQESGNYDPNHAHAYDARPANAEIGMRLVRATLADDRVRYVNYNNVRYYPDGHTDNPIDHPTFHVSMLPGTTNDTRPFFGNQGEDDVTPEDIREINKGTAMIVGASQAKVIEANRNQTATLRRAIWASAGKTQDEIKELEQADPIPGGPNAADLANEILEQLGDKLSG